MNWLLLSMGVVGIGVIGWIIIAGRAECKRMNSKK